MNLEAYYPYFFYVAVAIATVFLMELLYLVLASGIDRRKVRNRRLGAMKDGVSTEQLLHQLKRERGISPDGELRLDNRLRRLLVQAGLRLTVGRFVLLVLLAVAAIFISLSFLTRLDPLMAASIALGAGAGIPLMVVRQIRSRRQFRFNSQLPEALEVIVRSLRSGHPVPVAMALAAREMPDPLGSEFGIAVDEMSYGLETEEALANMYQRCGDPEMALVVTAMSLQSATGGNLSLILSNLSKLIRDRFALRRKVKALSAEGKISAWGMTILPIVLALYINLVNPRYYGDVWNEPIFLPIMFGVAIWSLVGDYIMFKMINFKY